ncbi:hypothetical protein L7F22_063296 [Adiantum nelumboides]|nr:hypothetical protein [Adiantum nelumboides]
MAASSLLLRSLALASSHRVPYTAGYSLYHTSFLQLRTETLSLRRSALAGRPFSAQALEVSEPVSEIRSSKKKKSPASSWEEAGAAFFVKKGKDAAEGGIPAEQRDEGKGISAPERVQSLSNENHAEEKPLARRNFQRKDDKVTNAFSDTKFGNSRSAPKDLDPGRRGFTGRNGSFARREPADMYSGRQANRGRGGRNGGFARRDSADNDTGREVHRGRGFREEFSNMDDDNRGSRWNARSGADGRNRWNARSDTDSRERRDGYANDKPAFKREGAFRKDSRDAYANDKAVPGREGPFRKEFGNSVDTSKSFFQNRNQGGIIGKRQFPDVDGGKRMFNGRFEGDGFVRNQMRGNGGEDKGNRRSKDYGSLQGGQLSSKSSSGALVSKQSEDGPEAEASSEDDEDDSEDFPQAGDVVRYSEMVGARKEINSWQSPVDIEGELQDENEAQLDLVEDEDLDVDEESDKDDHFGSARRELPVISSSLPKIIGEVVYGVGPVYAALQVSRREFFCLYVQQNMAIGGGNTGKKKDKKAVEWIIRTAVDRGVEVKEVTKHDLNMLADNRPHQGLILDASPLELVVSTHLDAPFEENGKGPVWVALDEVMDPQNFGAILRSAYFFGAKGVVICAKNSAPLSAVVSKASAGALEVMELRSCKNMMKFLNRSTENGWRVVGGSAAGMGVSSVTELPRGLPTILVLGGEGKGLRTNVKMSCSELVSIPGLALASGGKRGSLTTKDADIDAEDKKHRPVLRGVRENFIAVESLNVSVAAGILLHELLNNQAATESTCKTHPEVGVGEVLDHEQLQLLESGEQDQHSENEVEAVLGDEQGKSYEGEEQHCRSDVEATVSKGDLMKVM